MSALALRLTLALTPPPEPPEADPSADAIADPAVADPSVEPPSDPPPDPPADPGGGFGSVTAVTTNSDVVVTPPPSDPEPDPDSDPEAPRREMSLRAEVGYGQLGLASVDAPDHQGASLRAQFGLYPWLTKRRRFGVGVGFTYAYQGFNRRQLPDSTELKRSRGQQQVFGFRLPLLIRLHPEWVSLEPSGLLGVAFYSGGDVWAANRRAILPREATAFAAGGDLALCSVWDIVCVVGGAEYIVGLDTLSHADPTLDPLRVNPWGWHVGLGVDLVRAITRGNRTH